MRFLPGAPASLEVGPQLALSADASTPTQHMHRAEGEAAQTLSWSSIRRETAEMLSDLQPEGRRRSTRSAHGWGASETRRRWGHAHLEPGLEAGHGPRDRAHTPVVSAALDTHGVMASICQQQTQADTETSPLCAYRRGNGSSNQGGTLTEADVLNHTYAPRRGCPSVGFGEPEVLEGSALGVHPVPAAGEGTQCVPTTL